MTVWTGTCAKTNGHDLYTRYEYIMWSRILYESVSKLRIAATCCYQDSARVLLHNHGYENSYDNFVLSVSYNYYSRPKAVKSSSWCQLS